jgi:hypothetical protein
MESRVMEKRADAPGGLRFVELPELTPHDFEQLCQRTALPIERILRETGRYRRTTKTGRAPSHKTSRARTASPERLLPSGCTQPTTLAIATMSDRPATGTGDSLRVVASLPSCQLRLSPEHRTVRSLSSAHAKLSAPPPPTST